MMQLRWGWIRRLRALPLKTKLFLTVLSAGMAVLGASTYFSFRYWDREAHAATEQQALLAAGSARAAVESALRQHHPGTARQSLRRLHQENAVLAARVYRAGTILVSGDGSEEGRPTPNIWIPDAAALPRRGVVRRNESGETVQTFLPLFTPDPAILEVDFSTAATHAAMARGAMLGAGLLAVSLLAVVLVVLTMFEKEVVEPVERMDHLLQRSAPGRDPPVEERPSGDLSRLERSVSRLIEREREAEAREADTRERLREQAGLAQIGELAAEMAHEFKRPLASIRSALDLLEQEYIVDGSSAPLLQAVRAQLEHLQETMQDLFALARPVVLERESVTLCNTMDEALVEVSGLPRTERVDFHRNYGAARPRVEGDARRLRQAFVNLLINSVEAMPGGGRVEVTVVEDSGCAEVAIRDWGPGMHPDEIKEAMRPFHSTKPLGTGLGLPLVARIVSAHGGALSIDSRPGEGTQVRVRLPLVPGEHNERSDSCESESSSSTTTIFSATSSQNA